MHFQENIISFRQYSRNCFLAYLGHISRSTVITPFFYFFSFLFFFVARCLHAFNSGQEDIQDPMCFFRVEQASMNQRKPQIVFSLECQSSSPPMFPPVIIAVVVCRAMSSLSNILGSLLNLVCYPRLLILEEHHRFLLKVVPMQDFICKLRTEIVSRFRVPSDYDWPFMLSSVLCRLPCFTLPQTLFPSQ